MLKRFSLKNYRNFKDEIMINFEDIAGYQFNTECITNGILSKMLIYGKNATGKTNLGRALMDINTTLYPGFRMQANENFMNADSDESFASFSYTFEFDDKELIYKYERYSVDTLKREELIIDNVTIFICEFDDKNFNFENLNFINAETAYTQRYVQSLESDEMEEAIEMQLPFLRWLIHNVAFDNDSILLKLDNYVQKMIMIITGNNKRMIPMMNERFYQFLESENHLHLL